MLTVQQAGSAAAIILIGTATASAAALAGSNTVSLFGQSVGVTTWDVSEDYNGDAIEPEGLAVLGGKLYVVALDDKDVIADYVLNPAGSLAGAPNLTTLDTEIENGLTVNTGGAGYGGAANQLVALLDSGGYGVVNLTNGTVINTGSVVNPNPPASHISFDGDEITYVSSVDRFLVINDDGVWTWYNHGNSALTVASSLDPTDDHIIDNLKGAVAIDAAAAQALTGNAALTDTQYLLLTSEPSQTVVPIGQTPEEIPSSLFITDLAGNLLAESAFDPTGILTGALEGIAYDAANQRFYIGDSENLFIHTFAVPEPATASLLAFAAAGMMIRRR